MFNFRLLPVAVIVALLAPALAVGDEIPFPFAQVDRAAVAIGFVDVSQLTADRLNATAAAVLGDEAELMAEPIAQADAMMSKLAGVGVQRIYLTIAPPAPPNANNADARVDPVGQLFVRYAAGADAAAVQAALKEQMDGLDFAPAGDRWLRHDLDGAPVRAGFPADRRVVLDAELKAAAGRAGGFAAVMTDDMRMLIRMGLPGDPGEGAPPMLRTMAKLGPMIAASQRVSGGLALGAQPTITLRIANPDEPSAQSMADTLTALRDQMSQMMKQAQAGGQPPEGEMTMMAMLGAAVLDPKREGAVVVNTITADHVRPIAGPLASGLRAARQAAQRTVSASNARQLLMAIHIYAVDNGGAFPPSLDALFKDGYIEGREVLANPNTGDNPGYEYVNPGGKLSDLANPSQTPLIYELRDGKRDPNGVVGFADGHVEFRR